MTEESSNRRASLRPRPTPRVRPGPRADAVILYTVDCLIPKADHNVLGVLLDQFRANEVLQARCIIVDNNARRYLILDRDGLGQRYKAAILIPAGTLLAVYSGSLERVRSGEEDALNHSMDQGKIDFNYDLRVNGTPRAGDTHPAGAPATNQSLL